MPNKATRDSTTDRAEALLAGGILDEAAADKVEALLDELDTLAEQGAELNIERRKFVEDYRAEILTISERQAAINKELQALLPASPAPPQGVSLGG